MKYVLKKAKQTEVEEIFSLYLKRIQWMNEKKIDQWNNNGYLDDYPVTYYYEQQKAGRLYVMKIKEDAGKEDRIAGAVVLLSEDPRWEDGYEVSAYYLHNFVTDQAIKGVGREIIKAVEVLAEKDDKEKVRLDCSIDNPFLNQYYESMGYQMAGTCKDGVYEGNRREKCLVLS